MLVSEAIQKRVSIRRYEDASIPQDHMEALLSALQLAPSANNFQNWEFVFAGDPSLKEKLVPACLGQRFITGCTYFIAGVADPNQKWHMVDITIALTQFTLQAVDLGYGTCWIGAFDEHQVKRILNVPENRKVVICMAFGKPEGRHVTRGRKVVEEIIYLNQFGNRFSRAGNRP